ncbi:MAG: hypothetical protein E7256_07000 [Lachnospiraceae bacterium]|nr:hypothetical protein [Lachnospiraceae bacterium]
MNKNQGKDGLTIANYIAVTLNTNKKQKLSIMAELLLLAFALYGSLYACISSFDITPDRKLLVGGTVILALLYYGIELFKKGTRYLLPVYFLLQAFVAWKYFFYIENGFYYIENAVIKKAAGYYEFTPISFVTEGDARICIAAFFLVIASVLSFFLVTAIRFQLFGGAFYLLAGILAASGFIVGIIPAPTALIGLFLAVYMLQVMEMVPARRKTLYAGEGKKKQEVREGYRRQIRRDAALLAAGIVLMLVILVMLIFPRAKYEQSESKRKETKHALQRQITNFFTEGGFESLKEGLESIDWSQFTLFEVDKAGGGISAGHLGRAQEISYTGETALVVTAPEDSDTIYLKGFAAAYYAGDLWGGLTSAQKNEYRDLIELYGGEFRGENLSEPLYVNRENRAMASDGTGKDRKEDTLFTRYSLQLLYENANKSYLYLPYQMDLNLPFRYDTVDDLYNVPSERQTEYQIHYRNITSYAALLERMEEDDRALERFDAFEEEYRRFVYGCYLQLPEQGLFRLKELDLGVDHYDGTVDSMTNITRAIKKYLSDNTVYSLKPGRLPEGADFVENFLFDAKKGYCMHYASAAVLLYRKYGVPARYVEGYVVTKADIASGIDAGYEKAEIYLKDGAVIREEVPVKQVKVTDESAHAWAEIYKDGYGWVPVEVTVGYMEPEPEAWEEPIEELREEEVTKEEEMKEEGMEETEESERKPEVTVPSDKSSDHIQSAPETIPKEEKRSGRISLAVVLLLIGIAGVIWVQKNIRFSKMMRKINGQDKEAVLLLYEQILKIRETMAGGETKRKIKRRTEKRTKKEAEEKIETKQTDVAEGNERKEMERVRQIALKARFSNLEITKEEYQTVYRYYQLLRSQFYQKGWNISKIYAKFIKAL